VTDAPRLQVSGIDAPELRALYDVWRRAYESDGRLPTRDQLGFAELLPWLGRLAVFDLSSDPARVVLWGTGLVDKTGVELTGRRVENAAFGAFASALEGLLAKVANERWPSVARGTLDWCDRPWQGTEHLYMPLSESGGRATRVLAAFVRDSLPTAPPLPFNAGRSGRFG